METAATHNHDPIHIKYISKSMPCSVYTPMRIISPVLLTTTTEILFLSRKRARENIMRLCPRDIYTGMDLTRGVWTLEHVVPQSRIRGPGRKNDLHNLGGLHTRINSSRGNKKFGDPMNPRDFMGCKISPTLFSPMMGKGEVARKCAYMIESYGEYIDIPSVIDPTTMMEWNYMYPPRDDEKRRNDLVFDIQGTYNRFVDDSSVLHETLYWTTVKNVQNTKCE